MFHRISLQFTNILNYCRSLIFCMRAFPFSVAIHCPIMMHYRTRTYMSKGAKLVVGVGKVKIGVHAGSYDLCIRPTRFCIYDDSSVIFRGSCNISRGTNVIVRYGGEMIIGDNFFCNANCNLLCNKKVEFEDDVLLGWNVTVLDSDGHTTMIGNEEGICTKPIQIGEHSWLSANTTVLKGVSLAEDTIVPYGMVVYKSNIEREVMFANKVLKSNIRRNE